MSEAPREEPGHQPVGEDDEARGEGLGRILALSDGVFAIALTILVIEIALPAHVADEHLRGALARLGPKYVAYVLSFLVIGRFWLAHHLAFRYIARFDGMLLWLNLILLMMVAFLPFPTSVLGNYGNVPEAALLYGVAAALTSGASATVWWYASGCGRLLRPGTPSPVIRTARARSLSGPIFFACTLPVAAFAPYVAEGLWVFGFTLVRILVVRVARTERASPS
jgi:uncharacterized membrane protein